MIIENDLTKQNVFKAISLFALPMLLGNMLQQLYNVVDTWIVGKYIGSDALAAVGAVFALMVFLTSVLIGLCMGCGVVFSMDYGRQDFDALRRRVGAAWIGITGVSIAILIVTILGVQFLLVWMNIPEELLQMTGEYLQIILWGIPAVYIYNFFASYLKALGNSVVPLLFLAVSAVANIILDFLFVVRLQNGVAGAAYATIIAQYLSGGGCALYVLFRDDNMRKAMSQIQPKWDDFRILMRYSVYTCLQQSVMNLGILMVQGIVNSFGANVMAAFAAGVKIDAFAYMPAQEYGNAFSTFIAQNYGAGKKERVKEGIRCAICTSGAYCIGASFVLWCFAKNLMQIFVKDTEIHIIKMGVQYLHIEGAFYIGIGCLFLLYGLYRAIGRPEVSLILTVISLGTRVLLAKIAAMTTIGAVGIWWAIPIGWVLADITGIVLYRKVKEH